MSTQTTVHLLRHGEVHNPTGVLYGRMDGYHLSDLGQKMAQRVADSISDRDITHILSSPLERAQFREAEVEWTRHCATNAYPVIIAEHRSRKIAANVDAGAWRDVCGEGMIRCFRDGRVSAEYVEFVGT